MSSFPSLLFRPYFLHSLLPSHIVLLLVFLYSLLSPTIISSSFAPLAPSSWPPPSPVCLLSPSHLTRQWPAVTFSWMQEEEEEEAVDGEQAADDKWANCFRLTMECLPACQAYSLLLSRQHPRGREEISSLSHATWPRSENVLMALLLFSSKLHEAS